MTTKRRPNAKPATTATPANLTLASDVEIAGRICGLLKAEAPTVCFEGDVWIWTDDYWATLEPGHVERLAMRFDGVADANGRRRKLGVAALHSIADCVRLELDTPGWFDNPRVGIPCMSGLIVFDSGEPVLLPHDPEHRNRHVLPGTWPCPAGARRALIATLLDGCFKDDPEKGEKIKTLQQVAGVVALGLGTRLRDRKVVILLGELANNGKSQFLDLFRSLVTEDARCALTIGQLGGDSGRFVPVLAGKVLNASDEMPSAASFASEVFKAVVDGNPISGRVVRKEVVSFRPIAQHVFCGNTLPVLGAMDRGVQRRLLVVRFERAIPESERIRDLGSKAGREEVDAVLAWAVEGARMVLSQEWCIAEPPSARSALAEWVEISDPVASFAADTIFAGSEESFLSTGKAFAAFKFWAKTNNVNERCWPSSQKAFVAELAACLRARPIHRNTGNGWPRLRCDETGRGKREKAKQGDGCGDG